MSIRREQIEQEVKPLVPERARILEDITNRLQETPNLTTQSKLPLSRATFPSLTWFSWVRSETWAIHVTRKVPASLGKKGSRNVPWTASLCSNHFSQYGAASASKQSSGGRGGVCAASTANDHLCSGHIWPGRECGPGLRALSPVGNVADLPVLGSPLSTGCLPRMNTRPAFTSARLSEQNRKIRTRRVAFGTENIHRIPTHHHGIPVKIKNVRIRNTPQCCQDRNSQKNRRRGR